MSLLRAVNRVGLLAPAEKSAVRFLYGRAGVQAGPAAVKVSKIECYLLQAFIGVGIMGYPAWVMYHIEEYKRRGSNA